MGERTRPSVRSESSKTPFSDRYLFLLPVLNQSVTFALIGQVPEPAGWALMPVAPIGELFGWLFALELPNSQAGFKVTGKTRVCACVRSGMLPRMT